MAKLLPTRSGGRFVRAVAGAFAICAFLAVTSLLAQEREEEARAYLDRLEWRGVLVLPGETQFSFHDQPGARSFWIKEGQIRNGIEVSEYDALSGRVTLRRGGVTRTLTLSESAVQALDTETADGPPPLVVVGQPRREAAEEEETGEIAEGAENLWAAALERSAQLREIDQQFRNINAEEARIREGLSTLSPDDPAHGHLAERAREIQEQRRVLTEGAVTEIGNASGISPEAGNALRESLRAGFSRGLEVPEQADEPNSEPAASDSPSDPLPGQD